MHLLFPITYFGNFAWHQSFRRNADVLIYTGEPYQKQSYRNRCTILSANGPLDLSVPVIHSGSQPLHTSEVKISYSTNWTKDHLGAIRSAYGKSPFFEYYFENIAKILNRRSEFLCELAGETLEFACSKTGLEKTIRPSAEALDGKINCSQSAIEPKEREMFIGSSYPQVFETKFPFQPNLCILDLLFNCGPESEMILENVKKEG